MYEDVLRNDPFKVVSSKDKAKENTKRAYISLMKELVFVDNAEPEDNFLDLAFGLGEVVEICGLNGTGKTQTCF